MFRSLLSSSVSLFAFCTLTFAQQSETPPIPDPLQPWESWATWDVKGASSPSLYSDPHKPITFWPSELVISADAKGASFQQSVAVFSPSWIPLPQGMKLWPSDVTSAGKSLSVFVGENAPVTRLQPGTYEIKGRIEWASMPQFILLPQEIGIVRLSVDGQPVSSPLWDSSGRLWLKRAASPEEAVGPDFLSANLFASIQDDIPLWLHTNIELVVSGSSREVDLGTILPQNWNISSVESLLPVAIDEAGRTRVQVRPGRWTIRVSAFMKNDARELRFAAGSSPAAESILVGFKANPTLRTVEITGARQVDATMTSFPEVWRNQPVYQWNTSTPLLIEERLRGSGQQAPEGLHIIRSLWLDEDGRGFTFRDLIQGTLQKIWRLNVSRGQDLGSVSNAGVGQLITRDPSSGEPGIEIRTRNISLSATGRIASTSNLPASGWQADADQLSATLNLPPGWRLFALFGADWVKGDWLTSWSLLDIFIVLIFILGIFRISGFTTALIAALALVLSFREPGAPQLWWLALLAPIAILRVVPAGRLYSLVSLWKWVTFGLFIFIIVPFLASQIQQAIYPQLEGSRDYASIPMPIDSSVLGWHSPSSSRVAKAVTAYRADAIAEGEPPQEITKKQNLLYEAQARIQTGPGIPDRSWRNVTFGWNGPVTKNQHINLMLIPATLERFLSLLRVASISALVLILLGIRRIQPLPSSSISILLLSFFFACSSAAIAQFPDPALLNTLRDRLLDKSSLPQATANIPTASLILTNGNLSISSEVHSAVFSAVPLPGRLPVWSPVSVSVDGKPASAIRRDDNFLWVALPAGVHNVRVEGLLGDADQWEWTFKLKPHRVKIDAEGWSIGGVDANGVPDQQVFFSRQQKSIAPNDVEAAYDRQEFHALAVVERRIELGLLWQVHTTVRRLTPKGKAIALRVPLLSGEKMLSSNVPVTDGMADVRIHANAGEVSWESELTQSEAIALESRADDQWVEQWSLVTSPVWNVSLTGLTPIFETKTPDLTPLWLPWPGESASIAIRRPEAIPGPTVTVRHARHQVNLGDRQRTSSLALALTSSLGEDFQIKIPPDAQITSLDLSGQSIPPRFENGHLSIPLRPGDQDLNIAWRAPQPMQTQTLVDEITLPIESANIDTTLDVPDNRWILWANGPQQGPAIRFWGVLAFALLAAIFLGSLRFSPLSIFSWMLLGIGLTQVSLPEALGVIAWLFFLLSWRKHTSFQKLTPGLYNLMQVALVFTTLLALGFLIHAVGAGLLGSPEMFISGNNSTSRSLQWYLPRAGTELPRPSIISVSVWWYRLAMLVWALWLAAAALRWLVAGWSAFTSGGVFRPIQKKFVKPTKTPPPVV